MTSWEGQRDSASGSATQLGLSVIVAREYGQFVIVAKAYGHWIFLLERHQRRYINVG